MDAICLKDKPPEVVGFFIKKLLSSKFKSALFNERITDQQIVSFFYLPSTFAYGLYRDSQPDPAGLVLFLNVLPGENCFVYMLFFDDAERGQGISVELCNSIKRGLLSKCPTLNSIETAIVENPDLEKMLLAAGFEKIGTRKHYKHVGEKYFDVSSFYYLCNEEE